MIAGTRLSLKHPSGWFAAGREVECALKLLSDAAFRLFMWLCLQADRSCGSICVSVSELSLALSKTKPEVESTLDELVRRGVCAVCNGTIRITDRFWPYQRIEQPGLIDDSAAFVAEAKRLFLTRRCVRSSFTAADERLALRWQRDGVLIVEVERTILLGSLRKYAALLNNGRGTPITALSYFDRLLGEVRQHTSPEYWQYVAQKVRALEQNCCTFGGDGDVSEETK